MPPRQQFEVVGQMEDAAPTPAPPSTEDRAASLQIMMMLLATLSKRVVVALADLFTLATVGSAFWLWMVTDNVDVFHLVKLGLYGLFVLAANIIVRRW